jgi:hypothetical protein
LRAPLRFSIFAACFWFERTGDPTSRDQQFTALSVLKLVNALFLSCALRQAINPIFKAMETA